MDQSIGKVVEKSPKELDKLTIMDLRQYRRDLQFTNIDELKCKIGKASRIKIDDNWFLEYKDKNLYAKNRVTKKVIDCCLTSACKAEWKNDSCRLCNENLRRQLIESKFNDDKQDDEPSTSNATKKVASKVKKSRKRAPPVKPTAIVKNKKPKMSEPNLGSMYLSRPFFPIPTPKLKNAPKDRPDEKKLKEITMTKHNFTEWPKHLVFEKTRGIFVANQQYKRFKKYRGYKNSAVPSCFKMMIKKQLKVDVELPNLQITQQHWSAVENYINQKSNHYYFGWTKMIMNGQMARWFKMNEFNQVIMTQYDPKHIPQKSSERICLTPGCCKIARAGRYPLQQNFTTHPNSYNAFFMYCDYCEYNLLQVVPPRARAGKHVKYM